MRSSAAGLMAIGVLFHSSVALAAADPAVVCEASKLKLAGKYGQCRLNAESKAVKSGDPVDYSKCSLAKFATAETKAAGACPTNGDQATVGTRVNKHTDAIATMLAGGLPFDSYFPATGQTDTFGTGDDGDVTSGAALSYTDNADGTITDNNTGLMWEKKILGTGGYTPCTNETGTCANPHHADNAYRWTQVIAPYEAYDGPVVTVFLNQLNNRCNLDTTVTCTVNADCAVPTGACGFAGYRDWRLPNKKELESIVDAGTYDPAHDGAFDGASCGGGCTSLTNAACSCTNPATYWSSTTYAFNLPAAWNLDAFDGLTGAGNKTSGYHARAVRGGGL